MNKILLTALLAASLSASAAQVLVGKPDDTLSARVSRSEPTLIRIDGHRVRRIFGAEGEFAVTADKEAGTAYLKPTTDKPTLSIFVSDENGRTWKLLLSVTDGPSDSITIKGRSAVSYTHLDVYKRQEIILATSGKKFFGIGTHSTGCLAP